MNDYGLRRLDTHLENLNRFLAFSGGLLLVSHDDSGMTSGLMQVLVLMFRLEVFDPRASSRFLGRTTSIPISQHLGILKRNTTNVPSGPRGKRTGSNVGSKGGA